MSSSVRASKIPRVPFVNPTAAKDMCSFKKNFLRGVVG